MSKYIFRNEKGGFESAYDKNSLMKLCYEEIADLQSQLAEKDKEIEDIRNTHIYRFYLNEDKVQDVYMTDVMLKVFNQDKISFAVDILEELADCSNYINSKLDFECGSYVSEKTIRDKIKYLKGKKDE